MLMTTERRPTIRTLWGRAIHVLHSGRHPRVRGARLDAGPRRSACTRAGLRYRPSRPANRRFRWGSGSRGSRRAGLDWRHLSRMPPTRRTGTKHPRQFVSDSAALPFPHPLARLPTILTAFFTAGADFRSSPPRTVLRSPARLPPAPGPGFVRAPSCSSSLPPSVPPVVTLKQRDRDSQVPERFEPYVEFFQWRFSVTNRWRPTARPTSRSCRTSSRANRRASSSWRSITSGSRRPGHSAGARVRNGYGFNK
ncbi:hypothetical protein ACVW1C_005498 [Bradyrhizobium sp. USDA 4011]